MPNRLIREGILDSEAVNQLTPTAENFFFRAIIAADDAGRLDGRPQVLASRTYPLVGLRDAEIEKRLAECVGKGLAIRYEWHGKPFVQVRKWQRCSPAQVSKFPDPLGRFRIEWVKVETRDGIREFVSSSVENASQPEPMPIPSVSHSNGIGGLSGKNTETETETETGSAPASVPEALAEEPSIQDVINFGAGGIGIPEDYCRHYHLQQTIRNGWVKNNKVIRWQLDLPRWWAKDRGTWFTRNKANGNHSPQPVLKTFKADEKFLASYPKGATND